VNLLAGHTLRLYHLNTYKTLSKIYPFNYSTVEKFAFIPAKVLKRFETAKGSDNETDIYQETD